VQVVAAQERAWTELLGAQRVAGLRRPLEEITTAASPR